MPPALAGALTGAALGAAGRAAIVLGHLSAMGKEAAVIAAIAAAFGAVIGAAGGLTGRPWAGVVVGAGLTLLLHLGTLPVVAMFRLLGAGTTPSVLGVIAVGAISGGVGAFVGRRGRGPQAHR